MLKNSAISLMLMLLLCFLGMLVMFLFMLRTLSHQSHTASEHQQQLLATLADMEQQLLDMHFILRQTADPHPRAQQQFQNALHDAATQLPQETPQQAFHHQESQPKQPPQNKNNPLAAFDIGSLSDTSDPKSAPPLELRLDK